MHVKFFRLWQKSSLLGLSLLVLGGASAQESEQTSASQDESRLLRDVRQYTFGGKRSGEGYFSHDGQHMIFQSERDADNPFYQIFLMDRGTGAVERVSTGLGKTTCAWIHPQGNQVLFASTHEDPEAKAKQEAELAERASGTEKRYAWDYDEHYEIYSRDLGTGGITRLTDALGYDAEASWDPRGEMIVFSSNRRAYGQPLSEEEQKIFDVDKSYFLDLYAMDADGGSVRQLTDVPGYDGGPFFSADGEYICFRRFSTDGATAEIHTMRRDGSEDRQLTRLGAMSWAPYFHPSGDYLIFATNIHGFGNFELYLVDSAGEKEPVRVTYTDGFDGLPVFTPDGKQLAWTTNRTPGKQSQIYLGDWDHAAALKLLNSETVAIPEAPAPAAFTPLASNHMLSPAITAADIQQHVMKLASEEFEGRLTGTHGEALATSYVADYFASLGLEPAGDNGTWFDTFDFTAGINLGPENALTPADSNKQYVVNQDWRPLAFSSTGTIADGGVVFAGYGIVAPAEGDFEEYDSFVHLDVTDKWVMAFRFLPEDVSPERRQHLSPYASLRFKATNVRDRGGKGLIVVSGPTSQVKEQLPPLSFDVSLGGTSVAAIAVADSVAQDLLTASGNDLETLQQGLDDGSMQMGFELEGVALGATIALEKERRTGRNVVARLETGLEGGAVAVGAHVDHLGRGGTSSSLSDSGDTDAIHYGADDNASGVAGMLEVAALMVAEQAAGRFAPKRDVLFMAWSGEELGLLGSDHYVKELAEATGGESIASAVSSYFNLDMIGRLRSKLVISGAGSSSIWFDEVERANAAVGLPVAMQTDSYLPTDATSFYLKQVPIFSAFTGVHGEYHTPKDRPELLNYPGAAQTSELLYRVAVSLAEADSAPDYIAMERPDEEEGRGGFRAYLGTVPDYAETDVKGLVLNGVTKGAPADKAGLKAGDVIVELAGKTVENIYDYTYAIQALKIGEEVKVIVERGGERVELRVTPESRQ